MFYYFILNTRYLIIRSIYISFLLFIGQKLTQVWRIKSVLRIYIFPSKFIKLCPESLKEHTDKISLRMDETQTFYSSSNIYPTITLKAYFQTLFQYFLHLSRSYIYWSKVLTGQPERCQFFRKYKIVKNLKTATIKQVIIHLSKLSKFIFRKSHYVTFLLKTLNVPYQNTRLQFYQC